MSTRQAIANLCLFSFLLLVPVYCTGDPAGARRCPGRRPNGGRHALVAAEPQRQRAPREAASEHLGKRKC